MVGLRQDRRVSEQLEFPISTFFEVHQLPEPVRSKWACGIMSGSSRSLRESQDGGPSNRSSQDSGDEDDSRLRQKQALEERMASAEIKRQNSISERRAKATKVLKAAENVLAQQEQQQEQLSHERAARLDAKLEQAERLREQQHAFSAQKLYSMLARAKAGSEAARLREEGRGLKRQAHLDFRLQRAEDARYEKLQIVANSLTLGRGTEGFLMRKSLARCYLRRQSSSRVIQKYWRGFVTKKGTTVDLISSFRQLGLIPNNRSDGSCPPDSLQQPSRSEQSSTVFVGGFHPQIKEPDSFDLLAGKLRSSQTIRTADKLLHRLALKVPASRKDPPGLATALQHSKAGTQRRYPARIFTSAFMILQHPEVIFNSQGDREASLKQAAEEMISAFQQLLDSFHQTLNHHPRRMSTTQHVVGSTRTYDGPAPALMLSAFDKSWIVYLEQFVAWQTADAANLEASLIKAAVDLETSKIQTLRRSPSKRPQSAADREAVVEQTQHDHALLRERIEKLSGPSGLSRLEAGLAAARAASNPSTPLQSPGVTPQSSPQRPLQPPAWRMSQTAESPPSTNNTNESLMWELLYDLDFQFPSAAVQFMWSDATGETDVMQEEIPENESAEARAVRFTRIADKVFYDNIQNPPPEYIVGLLLELKSHLIETLPPRNPLVPQLQQTLNKDSLLQDISQGSVSTLLPAFDLLASVLMESGSEHRENIARAVHARIRQNLASSADNPEQLSNALVKALRIMRSQLHLLSYDTMAYALDSMRYYISEANNGVEYARSKFGTRMKAPSDLPLEELAEKLPQTRAWLARGAGALPTLQLTSDEQVSEASSSQSVPVNMQTGRQTMRQAGSDPSRAPSEPKRPRPAVQLASDARGEPWRLVVRSSLANLMIELSLNSMEFAQSLPETLQLDQGRLVDAKDVFDRILVVCTCVLVAQTAQGSASSVDASALSARLESMIESDDMSGTALATEVAAAAGMEHPTAEQINQLEARIQKMVKRSDASHKALTNGLVKILQKELARGRSSEAELKAELAKFGAGGVLRNFGLLFEKLGSIAAVTEAVHEPTYQKLLQGLI